MAALSSAALPVSAVATVASSTGARLKVTSAVVVPPCPSLTV